jgi:hypothetical protein
MGLCHRTHLVSQVSPVSRTISSCCLALSGCMYLGFSINVSSMFHIMLDGYPRRIVQDLTRYHSLHILHVRQKLFPLHLDYTSVSASADGITYPTLQMWLITKPHGCCVARYSLYSTDNWSPGQGEKYFNGSEQYDRKRNKTTGFSRLGR